MLRVELESVLFSILCTFRVNVASILANYYVHKAVWLPYIYFTRLEIAAFWQNVLFIFIITTSYFAKFYFSKIGIQRHL